MMISLRQIGYHYALLPRRKNINMSCQPVHRLAKYIARSGHCSRRAAERLISQGRVTLNGEAAKHTDNVSDDDVISIDQQPLARAPALCYLAYHKPVGIDCNNRPNDGASLYQLLKQLPQRLFAVGRLDKDSCGLLLLTNDGSLCQRLLHPAYQHSKTYIVDTDKPITTAFLQQMANGVSWQLGENRYQSLPCQLWQTGRQQFRIVLTQGLHRQIRYMCKTLGYNVVSLKRIAIGVFELGTLQSGQYRPVTAVELESLLQPATLPQPQTK